MTQLSPEATAPEPAVLGPAAGSEAATPRCQWTEPKGWPFRRLTVDELVEFMRATDPARL